MSCPLAIISLPTSIQLLHFSSLFFSESVFRGSLHKSDQIASVFSVPDLGGRLSHCLHVATKGRLSFLIEAKRHFTVYPSHISLIGLLKDTPVPSVTWLLQTALQWI